MDNFSYTYQKNISMCKTFYFLLLLFVYVPNLSYTQWKSANGPYEATLYSISFDAQNPSIIYTVGEGVFRSTNSGESWMRIDPDTMLGTSFDSVIKADPKNAGVVYYGGNGALFKSTNYGDN